MTSSEKFDILSELDRKGAKVKLTTIKGEEIICKLHCFAEDEEDWAYDVITLEEKPRYLTYLCNQLVEIEELADD